MNLSYNSKQWKNLPMVYGLKKQPPHIQPVIWRETIRTRCWIKNALSGYNSYRIMSVGNDGRVQYIETVKVYIAAAKGSITIYPNPVTDGVIKLRFESIENEAYHLRLLDNTGQLVVSTQVNYPGGTKLNTVTSKKKIYRWPLP